MTGDSNRPDQGYAFARSFRVSYEFSKLVDAVSNVETSEMIGISRDNHCSGSFLPNLLQLKDPSNFLILCPLQLDGSAHNLGKVSH